MEGVLRFKNGLALCQKMRDFTSENAAPERMWVQCGGIGLLVVHAVFRLHFTYEDILCWNCPWDVNLI